MTSRDTRKYHDFRGMLFDRDQAEARHSRPLKEREAQTINGILNCMKDQECEISRLIAGIVLHQSLSGHVGLRLCP